MTIDFVAQQVAQAVADCDDIWTWVYVMSAAISALSAAIVYLFHKLMRCMKSHRSPWDQIERRGYDDNSSR